MLLAPSSCEFQMAAIHAVQCIYVGGCNVSYEPAGRSARPEVFVAS